MVPGVVDVQDQHPQRDCVTSNPSVEPSSNRGLPRVVVVTTPHCPNCRAIRPAIDALETEYRGSVETTWVDATGQPSIAADLRVHGVPTMVAFHADGAEGGRLIGRAGTDDLKTLYESALDPSIPAPTGITAIDRWIRTSAGAALLAFGLFATNPPVIGLGILLIAAGWYDHLLQRFSVLR